MDEPAHRQEFRQTFTRDLDIKNEIATCMTPEKAYAEAGAAVWAKKSEGSSPPRRNVFGFGY
jgi:hypothetical protein